MARKRKFSEETNKRLNAYVIKCLSQYYADLCRARHQGDIEKLLQAVETNAINGLAEYKSKSRSYKVSIKYGPEKDQVALVFNVSKYKLDKLVAIEGMK